MPVGLALTGRLTPDGERLPRDVARDWLARAAVWFEDVGDAVLDTRLVRDGDDKPVLLAAFHTASEPVEIRVGGTGRVKVSAHTSPAGPGYHAYLCETLKTFAADFDFPWDEPAADNDPGRYFVVSDRGRLETHFLRWLGGAATAVVREATPDGGPYSLGMPKQPTFTHPGPVLTPLGPRSLDWLKRTAADPAAGKDYFPWWEPTLDAAFYRGRALAELWLEFRWRPPLSDAEGEQVDQVAADLANAYDLDPDFDLPWPGWAAVLDAIAGDTHGYTVEPVSRELRGTVTGKANGQPAVGYRQWPVRKPVTDGWSIEVPGPFAAAREDTATLSAWDDGRTVWVRASRLPADGPTPTEAVAAARKGLPAGESIAGPPGLVAAAVFGPHHEDGATVWRLSGVAAADERMAVCNVYARRAEDRDWAIAAWRSLRAG